MGEADLLHVATGLIPISFSMAIMSHDSLTKHKVSLIESGVYLVHAAQVSAALDKTWSRAAGTGCIDEQSMDSGDGDRTR